MLGLISTPPALSTIGTYVLISTIPALSTIGTLVFISTLPALYVPPPPVRRQCSGVLYRSRRSRLSKNRRKPAKPAEE